MAPGLDRGEDPSSPSSHSHHRGPRLRRSCPCSHRRGLCSCRRGLYSRLPSPPRPLLASWPLPPPLQQLEPQQPTAPSLAVGQIPRLAPSPFPPPPATSPLPSTHSAAAMDPFLSPPSFTRGDDGNQGGASRERELRVRERERRKNGRRKRRREAGCEDGLVLVAGGGAPVAGRRRGEEEARAGRGLREVKELGLKGLLPSIQIGRRRA